jgi:hypothetical protein
MGMRYLRMSAQSAGSERGLENHSSRPTGPATEKNHRERDAS